MMTSQQPQTDPAFPYDLSVTRRTWLKEGVAFFLMLLLYLGMGSLPIWTTWLGGRSFELSFVSLRNLAFVFFAASFFFLPTFYITLVADITGSIMYKQPYRWTFFEDEIACRFPFAPWQRLPVQTLTHIYLEPVPIARRFRIAGRTIGRACIYHLRLRFSDGRVLEICHQRALQFGVSTQQMHKVLCSFYPLANSQKPKDGLVVEHPGVQLELPATLQMGSMNVLNSIMGVAFFVLCAVVTAGIALVLILSKDQGPNSTFVLSGGLFFTVFMGMAALAFSSAFQPRQPYKIYLHAGEVQFRRFFGPWQNWPVCDLQDIQLQPVQVLVRKRTAAGRRYTHVTWYDVVLVFSGERTLRINQERARQFGYKPAQLHALLRGLYGL